MLYKILVLLSEYGINPNASAMFWRLIHKHFLFYMLMVILLIAIDLYYSLYYFRGCWINFAAMNRWVVSGLIMTLSDKIMDAMTAIIYTKQVTVLIRFLLQLWLPNVTYRTGSFIRNYWIMIQKIWSTYSKWYGYMRKQETM